MVAFGNEPREEVKDNLGRLMVIADDVDVVSDGDNPSAASTAALSGASTGAILRAPATNT